MLTQRHTGDYLSRRLVGDPCHLTLCSASTAVYPRVSFVVKFVALVVDCVLPAANFREDHFRDTLWLISCGGRVEVDFGAPARVPCPGSRYLG